MRQIKVKKETSLLQAAWQANMIPETIRIIKQTKSGIIIEGQNLGNYRWFRVEMMLESDKTNFEERR